MCYTDYTHMYESSNRAAKLASFITNESKHRERRTNTETNETDFERLLRVAATLKECYQIGRFASIVITPEIWSGEHYITPTLLFEMVKVCDNVASCFSDMFFETYAEKSTQSSNKFPVINGSNIYVALNHAYLVEFGDYGDYSIVESNIVPQDSSFKIKIIQKPFIGLKSINEDYLTWVMNPGEGYAERYHTNYTSTLDALCECEY